MEPDSLPQFYTTEKVAKMFEVQVATVRTWIREGKLKAHRIGDGGRWRVERSDLVQFSRDYLERSR